MTPDRTNIVICPSCGAENIEGTDTCENCLMDLRTSDVPETGRIASRSDLLTPIANLRLHPARIVGPGATVGEAIGQMRAESAEAVVVVEGERIVGIFTERDVLKKVGSHKDRLDLPVTEFMTPDPVILREEDTIATALNKMGDGGFRHIPYTREGTLMGIVTGRDVMNWVMSRYFG